MIYLNAWLNQALGHIHFVQILLKLGLLEFSMGSKSLGYFHIPKIDIYRSTNIVKASVSILHYLKPVAFLEVVCLSFASGTGELKHMQD